MTCAQRRLASNPFEVVLRPAVLGWGIVLALGGAPLLLAADPAQVFVLPKAKGSFVLSLGDRVAGWMQVSLTGPGTVLGTLDRSGKTVGLTPEKNTTLTLLWDKSATSYTRDIRVAEVDQVPGWAWFRVIQPGRNQPLTILREGAVSKRIVYSCDTSQTACVNLWEATDRERAAEVFHRVTLDNKTRTTLHFVLNDTKDLTSLIRFDPPNADATDNTEGVLEPGKQRQILLKADVYRPAFHYVILIADGDDWRHLENMGAYDRFQVSLDLAHPLRFDHAPLVGAAVKPFTNIKFEVDESQPETPVLRMVPQ